MASSTPSQPHTVPASIPANRVLSGRDIVHRICAVWNYNVESDAFSIALGYDIDYRVPLTSSRVMMLLELAKRRHYQPIMEAVFRRFPDKQHDIARDLGVITHIANKRSTVYHEIHPENATVKLRVAGVEREVPLPPFAAFISNAERGALGAMMFVVTAPEPAYLSSRRAPWVENMEAFKLVARWTTGAGDSARPRSITAQGGVFDMMQPQATIPAFPPAAEGSPLEFRRYLTFDQPVVHDGVLLPPAVANETTRQLSFLACVLSREFIVPEVNPYPGPDCFGEYISPDRSEDADASAVISASASSQEEEEEDVEMEDVESDDGSLYEPPQRNRSRTRGRGSLRGKGSQGNTLRESRQAANRAGMGKQKRPRGPSDSQAHASKRVAE